MESDCQNLLTQNMTWTQDDTCYGWPDWKNIVQYDSYDGKRRRRPNKGKGNPLKAVIVFECSVLAVNPFAMPFKNDTAVSAVKAKPGNCYLFALTTLTGVAICPDNKYFARYTLCWEGAKRSDLPKRLLLWGLEEVGLTFLDDLIFHIFQAYPWEGASFTMFFYLRLFLVDRLPLINVRFFNG